VRRVESGRVVDKEAHEVPQGTVGEIVKREIVPRPTLACGEAAAACTPGAGKGTQGELLATRFERDLHDGAQQRLVSLALHLRAAQVAMPPQLGEMSAELGRVATRLGGARDELREHARGIHPATLAERGLGPALKTLTRRFPVPVDLQMRVRCCVSCFVTMAPAASASLAKPA